MRYLTEDIVKMVVKLAIAVQVEDAKSVLTHKALRQKVRGIRGVHLLKNKKVSKSYGGGVFINRETDFLREYKDARAGTEHFYKKYPRVGKFLGNRGIIVPRNRGEAASYIRRATKLEPGSINVDPRQLKKSFNLSRKGARKVSVPAVLHESFERKVKPKAYDARYSARFGHAGPEVILKEHNLLSRYGRRGGAEGEAATTLRKLRAKHEMRDLRRSMRQTGLQRGIPYLAPGEKIPSRLIKEIADRYVHRPDSNVGRDMKALTLKSRRAKARGVASLSQKIWLQRIAPYL